MAHWSPKIEKSDQPRYVQIAEAIRGDIAKGVLAAGDRLPSQRDIAKAISLDVSTISRGYVEAARRGYVDSFVGRGTFVRDLKSGANLDPRRSAEEDLRMNMPPEPNDPQLVGRMREGLKEVSANLVALLRYQSAIGSSHDRQLALEWMHANRIDADFHRLAITSGAHAALLAALATLRTSDTQVFCEAITYPGIRSLTSSLGMPLSGLSCDEDGILPEALDAALGNAESGLLYMNPTLQNPTTRTVPRERREELASVLQKHETPLIEDDAYAFVASNAPASITSMIPELGWYIAGLSKCFGAGLRLAYAVAPTASLHSRFVQNLKNANVMASPISITLTSNWIENGTAKEIQTFVRSEVATRQDIATQVLEGCSFEAAPEAFNVWLSLPEGTTRAEVLSRLPGRQLGIVPSDAFTVEGTLSEAMRVCLGGAISRSDLRSELSALRSAALDEEWIG